MAKLDVATGEVGIVCCGHTCAEGTKIAWRAGYRVFRAVLKYNLAR